MSKEFDPDWPHGHVTRDGRKARVVCKDAKSFSGSIVALIDAGPVRGEEPCTFFSNGRIYSTTDTTLNTDNDLLNAPEPEKDLGWRGLWKDGTLTVPFATRAAAMQSCGYSFNVAHHHLVLRGGKIVDVTED